MELKRKHRLSSLKAYSSKPADDALKKLGKVEVGKEQPHVGTVINKLIRRSFSSSLYPCWSKMEHTDKRIYPLTP